MTYSSWFYSEGILRRLQVTSNTAGNPSKPHLRRVPRQATLSAHYARYIIIIEGVWVVFVDLRTAIIIIVIIIVVRVLMGYRGLT